MNPYDKLIGKVVTHPGHTESLQVSTITIGNGLPKIVATSTVGTVTDDITTFSILSVPITLDKVLDELETAAYGEKPK